MKKLILAAILATTAFIGWRWQHAAPAKASGSELVFDRIWIDHVPTGERDTFNLFLAFRPESLGAFAEESMWHGEMERFRFEAEGDELRAVFPWSGNREKLTVHAVACHEADMDFCLDITGSKHGVSHYFSRNGWERRSVGDVDAFVAQLRHTDRAR